ncbi:DNA polymerase I [Yunchengibacter salinarum]|uniref:DNA polymerase I n=1 Tax=Yunchengibacter salinarum TaxID=3133399 RepID=UPI0035B59A88
MSETQEDRPDGGANGREHLYLVDGSGYIFRAYHALPPMTREDGTPVNAVYGFSNMLFKLLQDLADGERPTHLAVIFDTARQSFRNDIYPDYKANRPPPPEDLVPQFPLIRDAVKAFGVPSIEQESFEADDLIATYTRQAREKGWQVTIVSSDKDLMQLVDDGTVTLFDSMKNRRMDEDAVREKFGLGPDKVVDIQALAGDSSDNVPGVPGIGIKTAAQLIETYGDLDTLLDRADEIKQPARRKKLLENANQARISRDLVRLRQDVDVTHGLDGFPVREPDGGSLLDFIDAMQFRSLRARVVQHYGHDGANAEDPANRALEVGEARYSTITDMAELDRWIARIREAGLVAFDTETTSLNAARAELVGLSLAVEPGEACYVPVGHVADDSDGALFAERPKQLDKARVLAALGDVLADPAILKVGQNLKYDMSILAAEGLTLSPIADTMLMSYALDAGRHGHGMDELAETHLGVKTTPFKDVAGSGRNQVTFDRVEIEKATAYAAEDADITLRLYHVLAPRLANEGVMTVYQRLDRPLAPVLSAMERAGVKVDRARLTTLSGEFAEAMDGLSKQIFELAGRAFNINSPKQLGEILFDDLGLKGGRRSSKTGAYSTNAEVLEDLASEHDLPARVLDYRQFAKLKSTYTDALVEDINPDTGRVHTSFHMAATTTGRLSSNDPNLQNIPIRTEEGRKIREAFVAEKGKTLIAADYSQIELRVLAHMADIDALKQAFHDGVDIHALTASKVFNTPIDGMDPIIRRQAKAVNFGIIYGISAFGLARQLGVGRKEAQAIIDAYFERFPGIRAYMDKTIAKAREHGHVTTLFGRKTHVATIRDKNPNRRHFGERAAINAPIQGTAADIIRRAMIHMPDALANAGLSDVTMLLQVHDELVFEAPDHMVNDATPVIRSVMENAARPALTMAVPLDVDVGTGRTWQEAH